MKIAYLSPTCIWVLKHYAVYHTLVITAVTYEYKRKGHISRICNCYLKFTASINSFCFHQTFCCVYQFISLYWLIFANLKIWNLLKIRKTFLRIHKLYNINTHLFCYSNELVKTGARVKCKIYNFFSTFYQDLILI